MSSVASSSASPHPLRRALVATLALLAGVGSALGGARLIGLSAGSEAGYWIGVAGGVAMLALLLYPLRKRVRWMRDWGATRHWFIAHMALGLLGPWLVLLHCGGRIGSLNAGVALGSMAVVALSGVVGRFLYVQVHRGLSQQRLQLAELQATLQSGRVGLQQRLALVPAALDRLMDFERAQSQDGARLAGASPWPMLRLWWRVQRLRRALRRDVDAALGQADAAGAQAPLKRQLRQAWLAQADAHLAQWLKVAHFASWERLFSLWHVLHLPFVWVMAVCAVVHVVAVHAY